MSSIGNSMDNMILYNNFFSHETTNSQLPVSEPPVSEPPVSEPPVSEPPISEPPISQTSVFRRSKSIGNKPPVVRKTISAVSQLPVVRKSKSKINKLSVVRTSKSPVNKSPVNKSPVNKSPVNKSKINNKINPSVLVKTQNNITKQSLRSKSKVKLPDSKYKSYDSHNYDIFVTNNGQFLTMNNMCFVYRKSVNNYYNPQLSLQIYSTETAKNYIVHTSGDEFFNIKIVNNYHDLYDVLSTISKFHMINHPCEINFHVEHELLMEEYNLSILFHLVEDKLILDFSNNENNKDWDDIYKIITKDIQLHDNKIEISISNIQDWNIVLSQDGNNLLKLSFEKDCQVYLSGKWCSEIFNTDDVIGKCDVELRSDYF